MAIDMNFAIIIPVYNHVQFVKDVIFRSIQTGFPVIVVDDGSTDSTYDTIKDIEHITILRHKTNQGKGAAIITGFYEAVKFADWAITIDGDGQHCPEEIPRLIQAISSDRPIVIGMRKGMDCGDVPWTSRFGRKFSNFWVAASGGPKINDSQSGFRIYPLPECLHLNIKSKRYQFEVEILVTAYQHNIPIIETPISVHYDKHQRISHFRPLMDFLRNSSCFTRLICQRIFHKRI